VPGSLFGSVTGALGKRFFLTTWFPALLLVGALLAEVAVAAGVSRVSSWVQSLPVTIQVAGVALILLVVTLVAADAAGRNHCHCICRLDWLAHFKQVMEAFLSGGQLRYKDMRSANHDITRDQQTGGFVEA
jgi:uncharacterized membrane protein